jgi:predicted ABC-type ATPase
VNEEEAKLAEQAAEYVKKYSEKVIGDFLGDAVYSSDERPISVFMAGSPGAGKTEISTKLLEDFNKIGQELNQDPNFRMMRIDGDEIRAKLPGYTGNNSYIFQKAITIAVEKIHTYSLENSKSFILDTTFTGKNSLLNIERSVKRNRMVIINYIYQYPLVAWEVVKQRELVEGRHIPKESFIDQLFAALENVRDAQKKFGRDIGVWFVERNYASDDTRVLIDISNIDAYISIPFTKSQLRKLLQ